MERYPGLWRNLGRILSQRLVRTSRQISRPSLTNAVSIITDCAEGTAAVLAAAVARSLALQTGKRVLLVDVRAGSSAPIPSLSADQPAPTLAALLNDRNLAKQFQAPAENGAQAVRITSVTAHDQPRLPEQECMTALELLAPHYDFLLLLGAKPAAGALSCLIESARWSASSPTLAPGAFPPGWKR